MTTGHNLDRSEELNTSSFHRAQPGPGPNTIPSQMGPPSPISMTRPPPRMPPTAPLQPLPTPQPAPRSPSGQGFQNPPVLGVFTAPWQPQIFGPVPCPLLVSRWHPQGPRLQHKFQPAETLSAQEAMVQGTPRGGKLGCPGMPFCAAGAVPYPVKKLILNSTPL